MISKFKIEDRLTKMVGNTYMVNQKNQKILRYSIDSEQVRIITDVEDKVYSLNSAEAALNTYLEVEQSPAIATRPNVVEQTALSMNRKQLSDIIMNNIQRIQEDAGFIGQAQAINDQLKSMIDLGKAQLEVLKVQVMMNK